RDQSGLWGSRKNPAQPRRPTAPEAEPVDLYGTGFRRGQPAEGTGPHLPGLEIHRHGYRERHPQSGPDPSEPGQAPPGRRGAVPDAADTGNLQVADLTG